MSTAPHNFSIDLQALVDQEMQRGGFASPEDLLKQALQYWSEHRETEAAIDEAFEDIDAGRVKTWEEFDREFRAKHGLSDRA